MSGTGRSEESEKFFIDKKKDLEANISKYNIKYNHDVWYSIDDTLKLHIPSTDNSIRLSL